MHTSPYSYSSKRPCHPTPSFNPYSEVNQNLKLTHIPQVLIDISNSFLTFREQAKFRSIAKYFKQPRPIETLELLKEPLSYKDLSQDLFKDYTRIQQLYVSFEKNDGFPLNFGTFFKNPKFATVSKLHVQYFYINELFSMNPLKEVYKSIARSYLSTFQFSLIDLTLTGNSFDLYPLAPLINLQRLKIADCQGAGVFSASFLAHLTKLTQLTITNSLIVDANHLGELVNLTFLDLSKNRHLYRIGLLNKLTKLKYLNLAECEKIINIESLVGLSNLDYLNLRRINSPLIGRQSVNMSPITYLPLLKKLNLNFNNDYPDLRYLGHLNHLTVLSLNIGIVTDFSPLLGLTQLRKLECRNPEGSSFPDYTPIFQIESLTELHMIGALDRLPNDIHLPQLQILNLRDNKDLTEIRPLGNLIKLETLDLSYTNVTNLEPLSHLFQLRHLNIIPFFGSIKPLENLSNLKLLFGGSCYYQETISKLSHLEYLSLNITTFLNTPIDRIADLEPIFALPRLKEFLLKQISVYGSLIVPNASLDPRLDAFSKDSIISKYEHRLFPILSSLGEYSHDRF